MKQALDHAEAVAPGWKQYAMNYLVRYLAEIAPRISSREFMAEDVRNWAHRNGLELPPTGRAWGGIITKAANMGLIIKVGLGYTKNKKAHKTPAAIWRAAQ